MALDKIVKSEYRGEAAKRLLRGPLGVVTGVSERRAALLADAGLDTVEDLADGPLTRRALAVQAAAGVPPYDPGPPPSWHRLFESAPLEHFEKHAAGRFRWQFGPVFYRGRLDGTARVLVVGQDPSTDEALARRILVGPSGQRVQGFLRKMGVTRSYSMVNAFLFSVHGQFDAELEASSLEAPILAFRNAVLDRLLRENPVQTVLAFGRAAQHAVEHWPGRVSTFVVDLSHPAARNEQDLVASWNRGLELLEGRVEPDEAVLGQWVPYSVPFAAADEVPIPRQDLPFGLPAWHGTGMHSRRDGNNVIVWTL